MRCIRCDIEYRMILLGFLLVGLEEDGVNGLECGFPALDVFLHQSDWRDTDVSFYYTYTTLMERT